VHPESLTISVLSGTGNWNPDIQTLLEGLPQLKVCGPTCDPQEFLAQNQGTPPDLVLVDLDGENDLPQWLERLTLSLPQTSVLVCSHNRDANLLIRAMQMGVREFLPLPLNRQDLEGALERVWLSKKRLQPDTTRRGQVMVVTSHKGGSGATTMAINLALALAELQPNPVALVDLGRPFPDVGNFLDQEATYSIIDLIQNFANLDHSFIQRIMQSYQDKLFILHGCADFKEQDSIELDALENIFTLLRSLYKWIVVDLSHWLDGLFVQVCKEADVVLLLTELSVPDLRNLKKLWPMLRDWLPLQEQLKVVVTRYQKGSILQLRDLEQVIYQPAFATLPSDYASLGEAITKGDALATAAPRSKLYQSFKHVAHKLIEAAPGAEEDDITPTPAAKRKFRLFSRRGT
jgi:pilus assembly protein CpaE